MAIPSYTDKLYQEYLKMAGSSILGGVGGGGLSGIAGPSYDPYAAMAAQANRYAPWGITQVSHKHDPDNMRAALAIRMGWNVNQTGMKYFEHCEPRKLNDEKAVVFVIHEGKAMCIEDDLNLFPSDTLVTQLRLLQDT
jgi:hypothetical protein